MSGRHAAVRPHQPTVHTVSGWQWHRPQQSGRHRARPEGIAAKAVLSEDTQRRLEALRRRP